MIQQLGEKQLGLNNLVGHFQAYPTSGHQISRYFQAYINMHGNKFACMSSCSLLRSH